MAMNKITVLLFVLLVTYGFHVICNINKNLATIIVDTNGIVANSQWPKKVTLANIVDKLATIIEVTDRDGLATFRYIQRGTYIIEVVDSNCSLEIELERRFYNIQFIQDDNLECKIKRPQ